MRRLIWSGVFAAVLTAAACARLNEGLIFACESDDECGDSKSCVQRQCEPVRVDAGVDAGAGDSGTADAGQPDAGGAVAPCNSWQCVESAWPTPSAAASSLGVRTFPVPTSIDAGIYAYFGGVLLPDGRVLAIAHTADYFLLIDPAALTATPFGAQVANTVDGQRKWAGGVLAPNGKVYAFPFGHDQIIEVNPADAGLRLAGFVPTGGGYVGAAVDKYGFIWSPSEWQLPILRYDPETAQMKTFDSPDGGGWGGWWGAVRLPDDDILLLPKEGGVQPGRCPHPVRITPGATLADATIDVVEEYTAWVGDGGYPLQGGALTREGVVWSVPAGFGPVAFRYDPTATPELIGTDAGEGYGMLGTFGDGRVWTSPDSSQTTVRLWRFSGDGGVERINSSIATPRYGFLGLVATPQGMIAIPGGAAEVMLLQPGVALPNGEYDNRPMSVLLSPYFNKL